MKLLVVLGGCTISSWCTLFFLAFSCVHFGEYYISSRTVLFSWMDKFLNEKDLLSLPPEDQNRDDMAKTTNEQLKEKDAEIKRLRKALELEKLRSKAFSTMIDLAEETFNIPVRKKSGTKQ